MRGQDVTRGKYRGSRPSHLARPWGSPQRQIVDRINIDYKCLIKNSNAQTDNSSIMQLTTTVVAVAGVAGVFVSISLSIGRILDCVSRRKRI